MKTREILVRDVLLGMPDGNSVKKIERATVDIDWIDGKPKDQQSYMICGIWQVAVDWDKE